MTLNKVNFDNNTLTSADHAQGGAIFSDNAGGAITIHGGLFSGNVAQTTSGGSSSIAQGGAIYQKDGTLYIYPASGDPNNTGGTSFVNNHANGVDSTYTTDTVGGSAQGGALYVEKGNVGLDGVKFDLNYTMAGQGQEGHGGQGGTAEGGAIFVSSTGDFHIMNSTFTHNSATGGLGGSGTDGDNGGIASGGAIRLGSSSIGITIGNSNFDQNYAFGGIGGTGHNSGGDGGDAFGAAIAAINGGATQHLTVTDTIFKDNAGTLAVSGAAGFAAVSGFAAGGLFFIVGAGVVTAKALYYGIETHDWEGALATLLRSTKLIGVKCQSKAN